MQTSPAYRRSSMTAHLETSSDYRELASQLKLLLASIIRRASFDIALYRNDNRVGRRLCAVKAYNWMFEDSIPEDPEHRFTAFLHICKVLDQDPSYIRESTLKLKRADVKKYIQTERGIKA